MDTLWDVICKMYKSGTKLDMLTATCDDFDREGHYNISLTIILLFLHMT